MYSLSSIPLSLTVYSILDYRPLNTTLIINTGDSSVIVKQTFAIRCDTQANPTATCEIFRDDGNSVGSNSVLTTSVSEVKENNWVTFTCKCLWRRAAVSDIFNESSDCFQVQGL